MNLKPILLDTHWALIVTDFQENSLSSCVNTSIRIRALKNKGLKITHAGAITGGTVIPAMFIHNITPEQLNSIRESNPPLILCPSYLHFRDDKDEGDLIPDPSTLSVYEGAVDKATTKAVTHMVEGNVHIGMFTDLDLRGLPTDDPSIPFLNNIHTNVFVYSINVTRPDGQHHEEIERLCNLRNIPLEETAGIFMKEARRGLHTARTQRFRQVLADSAKKQLKNPIIFGYRYKDKEGNYV